MLSISPSGPVAAEDRSLEVAVQAQASNHLLLLRLRGVVLSEIGKGQTRVVSYLCEAGFPGSVGC